MQALRVIMLLSAVAACAGQTPATDVGASPEQQSASRRDRDVITQEELSQPSVRAQSLLDLIRSTRPHFLNQRGKNSHSDDEAGAVHVSIDNGRILPLQELANIHAGTAFEVRYLNASAAMQRFGGAAREGPVILVTTVKR
jgi:hypothetical protein